MAKYIDAVELAEKIKNTPSRVDEFTQYDRYDGAAWRQFEILDMIKEMPGADVENVVRCKDCKYAKPVIHRGERLKDIYRCSYLKPNTDMFDIDYCRYGKKKDGEE